MRRGRPTFDANVQLFVHRHYLSGFPNFKAVRLYLEKNSGECINRAYSVDRAPLNPACRFALKVNENMGFRAPASTDENLRCRCQYI